MTIYSFIKNNIVMAILVCIIILNIVAFNATGVIHFLSFLSLNYVLLFLLLYEFFAKIKYKFKFSNGVRLYYFANIFFLFISTLTLIYFANTSISSIKSYYVNYFIIFLLIIVFYNYLINLKSNEIYYFLLFLMIIVGIGNFLTILQYILQLNWAVSPETTSDQKIIIRAYGLYLNPNIAGYNSIIGVILSASLILFYKSRRFLFVVLMLLALISGLLTFSKTFLLNLLIVFIIYIIYRKKYFKINVIKLLKKKTLLVFVSIIITLIYFAFSNDYFNEEQLSRLKTLFFFLENNEIDYSGRNELAELGVQLIKEKPILGYGYTSFTLIKDSNKFFAFTNEDVGIHNTIIRIWGEGGVFSLLLFVFFWFYTMYKIILNKSVFVNMIGFMLFITYMFYALTNHNLIEDYYTSLVFTFLCYLISSHNKLSSYIFND